MRRRAAFTLVELLVTITIIGILAAMMFGAIHAAQQSAKEYATKATIAKLNSIIMQRYESYLTRRVGFDTTGMTPQQIADADRAARGNPKIAARYRLDALRDLMRLEMPDARSDIVNGPVVFVWGKMSEPGLHKVYAANPPTADHDAAQCLYMLVSMGSPETMEQFSQNEIGTVDGRSCFIDGWGKPIMWLRWAPGFNASTIQPNILDWNANPNPERGNARDADHDPYDWRMVDQTDPTTGLPTGWRLVPLIYSAGPDGVYDIDQVAGYVLSGNPYEKPLGQPMGGGQHYDNITNHQIEQR